MGHGRFRRFEVFLCPAPSYSDPVTFSATETTRPAQPEINEALERDGRRWIPKKELPDKVIVDGGATEVLQSADFRVLDRRQPNADFSAARRALAALRNAMGVKIAVPSKGGLGIEMGPGSECETMREDQGGRFGAGNGR